MTQTTDEARVRLFDQLLARFQPGKLIDLGSGHGMFAERAADAGWQATGVDARGDRFPDRADIEWRKEDVRETDVSGYDLILNLGLFYHLDIDTQLSLLDRCSGTPMILDTHFAVKDAGFGLSEPVNARGYRGRYYSEREIQHVSTASFGNLESFWPSPRALYRMLNERGYDVFAAHPYYVRSRTFFLCLPR